MALLSGLHSPGAGVSTTVLYELGSMCGFSVPLERRHSSDLPAQMGAHMLVSVALQSLLTGDSLGIEFENASIPLRDKK